MALLTELRDLPVPRWKTTKYHDEWKNFDLTPSFLFSLSVHCSLRHQKMCSALPSCGDILEMQLYPSNRETLSYNIRKLCCDFEEIHNRFSALKANPNLLLPIDSLSLLWICPNHRSLAEMPDFISNTPNMFGPTHPLPKKIWCLQLLCIQYIYWHDDPHFYYTEIKLGMLSF